MNYDLALLAGKIIFLSYLLGSVPFGLIFTRFLKKRDVREHGSGNIGATNVLRVGGKLAAALTFFCDISKGLWSVIIAQKLCSSFLLEDFAAFDPSLCLGICLWLALTAAVVGHIFPFALGFRGGKGVATYVGALLGIDPLIGGLTVLTWGATLGLTRISSVASLAAVILSNFFSFYYNPSQQIWPSAILCAVTSALIIWRHKDNISRLIRNQERKI